IAFAPEDRFADGSALALAIDEATRSMGRSKRVLTTAPAVALVALAAAGVVAFERWRHPSAHRAVAAAPTEQPEGAVLFVADIPPSKTAVAEAEAAYREGTDSFSRGDFTGASADFDRAIALDPRFASANLQRAYMEITRADPDAELLRRTFAQATRSR